MRLKRCAMCDQAAALKSPMMMTGTPDLRAKRAAYAVLASRVLAAELGGKVEVAYGSSGVVCTIDAPMPDGQPRGETG